MNTDPREQQLHYILVLGVSIVYVVALGFLAVEWLLGGHSDLKDIVIGGFGFMGSAMALIVGHYIGGQSATRSLTAGVALAQHPSGEAPQPPQPAPEPNPPGPLAPAPTITAAGTTGSITYTPLEAKAEPAQP